MANTNLYSLAQINGSDVYTSLVEDYVLYTPEFYQMPAIAHAGTDFKTTIRTGLPNAAFRLANQSLTGSASTYKQTIHQMAFIDAPVVVDEMIYKGADGNMGDLLYLETQGALQAVSAKIATQTWYGASNDGTNGFVGIRAQLNPTGSTYSNGVTVVTASNANNSTTAYLLWQNPQGVSYAVGKYGEIAIQPITRQWITTGANNSGTSAAGYWAYVSTVSAWVGLTVASTYSAYGVTGITNTAPLTDNLAVQLLVNVPLTRRIGMTWWMNPLAHTTLEIQRSSIKNQPSLADSGAPAFSPPPLRLAGLPIVLTNAITNTENNA